MSAKAAVRTITAPTRSHSETFSASFQATLLQLQAGGAGHGHAGADTDGHGDADTGPAEGSRPGGGNRPGRGSGLGADRTEVTMVVLFILLSKCQHPMHLRHAVTYSRKKKQVSH